MLPDPHAAPRARRSARGSPSARSCVWAVVPGVSLDAARDALLADAARRPSAIAREAEAEAREQLAAARRAGRRARRRARAQGEAEGRVEAARERGARGAARAHDGARRPARGLRGAARRARAAVLALRGEAGYAELLERLAAAARRDLGDDAAVESDPPDAGGVRGTAGSRASTTRCRRSPTRCVEELGPRLAAAVGVTAPPSCASAARSSRRRDARARACSSSSRSAASGCRARSSRCAASAPSSRSTSTRAGSPPASRRALGGGPLTAELGPGPARRRLRRHAAPAGDLGERLRPGARAPTLVAERRWPFTPALAPGDGVGGRRASSAPCPRRAAIEARVLVPPGVARHGRVDRAGGRRTRSPSRSRVIGGRERAPRAALAAAPAAARRHAPRRPRCRSAPASASLDLLFPVARGSRPPCPAASAPARRCCCSRSPSGATPT